MFLLQQDQTAGKYICLIMTCQENSTFSGCNFLWETLGYISGPSLKEVAFRWSHCYCKIICRQNKFVSGVITHTKVQGRTQTDRLSRSFSKQGHFTFLSKTYGSRNRAKEAYTCLHGLVLSMWDWIKCYSYFIILSWWLQYLLLIQNYFFKNIDFEIFDIIIVLVQGDISIHV